MKDHLWLVFRDEGVSLHRLMYASAGSARGGGVQMLEPSAWWWALRQGGQARLPASTFGSAVV